MRNHEERSGGSGVLENTPEVVFTRTGSIADVIESLMETVTTSIEAALYGFSNPRLVHALEEAQARRVRVRLIVDANKYGETSACQQMLAEQKFSFRVAFGREGSGSKMHHKFALLDRKVVLTGSYNWTSASEGRNYENLLILRHPELVEAYRAEFTGLWEESVKVSNERSQ